MKADDWSFNGRLLPKEKKPSEYWNEYPRVSFWKAGKGDKNNANDLDFYIKYEKNSFPEKDKYCTVRGEVKDGEIGDLTVIGRTKFCGIKSFRDPYDCYRDCPFEIGEKFKRLPGLIKEDRNGFFADPEGRRYYVLWYGEERKEMFKQPRTYLYPMIEGEELSNWSTTLPRMSIASDIIQVGS